MNRTEAELSGDGGAALSLPFSPQRGRFISRRRRLARSAKSSRAWPAPLPWRRSAVWKCHAVLWGKCDSRAQSLTYTHTHTHQSSNCTTHALIKFSTKANYDISIWNKKNCFLNAEFRRDICDFKGLAPLIMRARSSTCVCVCGKNGHRPLTPSLVAMVLLPEHVKHSQKKEKDICTQTNTPFKCLQL